ncbi:metallophosphoesterase [Roseibium aggregatum]|uniref:Calcineurin-like phosphoesterase domain-containing protein n=1 Tax=Roseibium aggregatum TaxID=187304 RepID=A0A0M6Y8B6_9HYPH|nr:metallophosphoesterase [Roseibium aggregatum]CTQ45783.1 hypothetical protein LAL4801_04238 [Roseibium aggregatum]
MGISALEAKEAYDQCGSYTEAAKMLGVHPTTVMRTIRRAEATTEAGFETPDLPSSVAPVEEIIERQMKAYKRKRIAAEARSMVDVQIRIDGPYGIAHGGDPHLDDNGANWPRLLRDLECIKKTEGLFGANVGDVTNNWIGRLAALYANQNTTENEAWKLAEWFIEELCPLYLVGGNHDVWAGGKDPLKWMMGQQPGVQGDHGVRLRLKSPSGRDCLINARHDFPGRSQYSPTFGPAKAAFKGHAYHILTCGHTHVSGYQIVKNSFNGTVSHALRVGAYKQFDDFADKLGFDDHHVFECPVTVINPEADDERKFVKVFFDPEEGADYLNFARTRYKQAKTIH